MEGERQGGGVCEHLAKVEMDDGAEPDGHLEERVDQDEDDEKDLDGPHDQQGHHLTEGGGPLTECVDEGVEADDVRPDDQRVYEEHVEGPEQHPHESAPPRVGLVLRVITHRAVHHALAALALREEPVHCLHKVNREPGDGGVERALRGDGEARRRLDGALLARGARRPTLAHLTLHADAGRSSHAPHALEHLVQPARKPGLLELILSHGARRVRGLARLSDGGGNKVGWRAVDHGVICTAPLSEAALQASARYEHVGAPDGVAADEDAPPREPSPRLDAVVTGGAVRADAQVGAGSCAARGDQGREHEDARDVDVDVPPEQRPRQQLADEDVLELRLCP